MKRIWSIISRIGTILFTVGFTFLILSLFAQTVYGSQYFNEQTISSQQFQPLGARYDDNTKNYTAYFQMQMSIQDIYNITINSNLSLNVYLIDMNLTELAPNNQISPDQLSQSKLENLLQTKSAMILWQGSITNKSIIYTPIKDGNITVLVSNPSNETAQIQYNIMDYHLYTPRILSMEIGAVTIPLGLVLAAPLLKVTATNNYRRIRNRIRRK